MSRHFRKRRNRALCAMIDRLAAAKGGQVTVLDIGGSLHFWLTVPEACREKCQISLINVEPYPATLPPEEARLQQTMTLLQGDGRDLSRFADSSFDLVVCNSVIEHVGSWADMSAVAREARRIGRSGWIQVPAFEFPVEQHFLLPFIHWFADPIQVTLLRWMHSHFRRQTSFDQYMGVHHVRPLAREQLFRLFPEAQLRSEWFLLPKSHIATW